MKEVVKIFAQGFLFPLAVGILLVGFLQPFVTGHPNLAIQIGSFIAGIWLVGTALLGLILTRSGDLR